MRLQCNEPLGSVALAKTGGVLTTGESQLRIEAQRGCVCHGCLPSISGLVLEQEVEKELEEAEPGKKPKKRAVMVTEYLYEAELEGTSP